MKESGYNSERIIKGSEKQIQINSLQGTGHKETEGECGS